MEKNLETEIIEALKSGKEEAFRYIYKTYYTDLCRIARGYLTDSYQSESIVEDLVYSLWENRSKITINTSLKNYLFRSVANKCINYLQLEYVRRETACSSEDLVIYSDLWSLGENPVEHLEGKELHSIIQKTIDGLSPETRKVFLLSRFENKRQEEIAEIMPKSWATLATLLPTFPTPMIPIVSSFSLLFLTDFHTRSDDCIYWATEAELHPGAFVHSIPACLQYSVSIWSKPMVAVAMNFTRLPSNKSRLQCVRVRTISASASRTSSGVKSFPGA